MTAKLYEIKCSVTDIPRLLRNIADSIDGGEYGNVIEGALVLSGESFQVFGLGSPADATVAYYLLGRAQRKLERIELL